MFFFLSKILDVFLAPLTWVLLLVAAGLLASRWPRHERRLRAAGFVGLAVLYLFSTELVANALWRATEAPPLTTVRPGVTYDAVIVLGGMLDDRAMRTYGLVGYNDNVDRLIAARDVLARGQARKALLSGGDANPGLSGTDEASVLARQLQDWGIDPSRLVVENVSRNTRENAVEAARIARREGWRDVLLVTSAFHMPRALGCFRALGLPVDTLAVDLRSDDAPRTINDVLPRTHALHLSSAALRELAGRVIYRLRGYSA